MSCVGVPVSWPRLERFASGGLDRAAAAEIAAHVDACEACRACLDEIRADVVVLPPLPDAPVRAPARWVRWIFGGGALALAAAAVLVLLVRGAAPATAPGARVAVKGAGEVVLSIVRERDGAIAYDPRTFATTDRWKVRVTCDPGPSIWADVVVYQAGAASFPLAPARIGCGNDVTLPGAFRIDARAPALVCVALSAGPAPDRAGLARPASGQVACAALTPE